jgi:hypothetical protein
VPAKNHTIHPEYFTLSIICLIVFYFVGFYLEQTFYEFIKKLNFVFGYFSNYYACLFFAIISGYISGKVSPYILNRLIRTFKVRPNQYHPIAVSLISFICGIVYKSHNNSHIIMSLFILSVIMFLCFHYISSLLYCKNKICDDYFPGNDLLDRSDIIAALRLRLISQSDNPDGYLPNIVTIIGNRGSGKSFIIKSALHDIMKQKYSINLLYFRPWNHEKPSTFVADVISKIFELLSDKYVIYGYGGIIRSLKSYGDSGFNVATFLTTGTPDLSAFDSKIDQLCMWIKEFKLKFIIVYDDLDRCSMSEVISVLRLSERLSETGQILSVWVIDEETLKKLDRYDIRVDHPVRITT